MHKFGDNGQSAVLRLSRFLRGQSESTTDCAGQPFRGAYRLSVCPAQHPTGSWCGRVDSNHHALASASPSSWCVCQFRHDRVTHCVDEVLDKIVTEAATSEETTAAPGSANWAQERALAAAVAPESERAARCPASQGSPSARESNRWSLRSDLVCRKVQARSS